AHVSSLTSYICLYDVRATAAIYTLSLHDALPIFERAGDGYQQAGQGFHHRVRQRAQGIHRQRAQRHHIPPRDITLFGELKKASLDRKSTRLNSSHDQISYAVFCLKKKR